MEVQTNEQTRTGRDDLKPDSNSDSDDDIPTVSQLVKLILENPTLIIPTDTIFGQQIDYPISRLFNTPSEFKVQSQVVKEDNTEEVPSRVVSEENSAEISSAEQVIHSSQSSESSPEIINSTPNGSTSDPNNNEDEDDNKRFRRSTNVLLEQIKCHKHATLFYHPITASDYLKAVKMPMDLSTIKRLVDSGHIRTPASFERHVFLMFVNAIMYNSEEREIFNQAKEMEADIRLMLREYKMNYQW